MYDGDGSPESPFLVPVVGVAGASVTVVLIVKPVVLVAGASVTVVLIVKPVVLAVPSVGGTKQLQIKKIILLRMR